MSFTEIAGETASSPNFNEVLFNSAKYEQWREMKLQRHPNGIDEIVVEIEDPCKLTQVERQLLRDTITRCNFAIYAITDPRHHAREGFIALARQCGLSDPISNPLSDQDNITTLSTNAHTDQSTSYIPYTNRALNWHTDGYYNESDNYVCAFFLHCQKPAAEGGANSLMDPEIAYILLRDENPKWARALLHEQAVMVPANIKDGVQVRPEISGPVFSLNQRYNCLHMRYTARSRNIYWRDDAHTREAANFLLQQLEQPSPWKFQHRLQPGQGIVCNNVLHKRQRFEDKVGEERLFYRARYAQRISL